MKGHAQRIRVYSKRNVLFSMLLIVSLPRRIFVQCFKSPSKISSLTSTLASSSTTSVDIQQNIDTFKEFPRVILKRNQQSKTFRNGNPLIFSKAIERYDCNNLDNNSDLTMADVVQIFVAGETNKKNERVSDVAIGFGVYNPSSLYRIRMLNHKFLQPQLYETILSTASSEAAIAAITMFHIENAIHIRKLFLNIPNSETDTYRLVNGEGDGLSGLAVDVINDNVVVMSSAAWCERYKTIILQILEEALGGKRVHFIWKTTASRLQQDGVKVEVANEQEDEVETDDGLPITSQTSMVVSRENGIEYETYPSAKGQKTGFYADQRENRKLIASLCSNKRVLDLCCYTGGFALNAARVASLCTGIDSSAVAISMCKANAARNGFLNVEFIQSDITEYLQKDPRPQYDVVILDPPKLAPMAKVLDKARRKYHALNRDAINAVNEENGGLLFTCTCSAAMTQAEGGQYFLKMVQGAALAAGRTVTLLSVSGAAPCHTQSPIAFPASSYLTAALFYVHPKIK